MPDPQIQTPPPQQEPQQKDPRTSRRKLYDAIFKEGKYRKSFDDFEAQFSSPKSRSKLYNALKSEGKYTKDESDFNSQFFGDTQQPSAPKLKPTDKYANISAADIPMSAHDVIASGLNNIVNASAKSKASKLEEAGSVLKNAWDSHKDEAVKDVLTDENELSRLTQRRGGTQMDYVQFWKAPNNDIAVALQNAKSKDEFSPQVDNVAPKVSAAVQNLIKQSQRVAITPDEINKFVSDPNTNRVVVDKIINRLKKEGNEKDANRVAASAYRVDASTRQSKDVDKNVEAIEKGDVHYNVETQELVKPLKGVDAFAAAYNSSTKDVDEGNWLMSASEKDRIDYLEKAIHNEHHPDKPVEVPEGAMAMAGSDGVGMLKAFGTSLATTFLTKNPVAGSAAGAEMIGTEYAAKSFKNELVRSYAQVKDELLRSGVPESEAIKQAASKATANATVAMMTDFATNAAMAYTGLKYGSSKPLIMPLQKGTLNAAKQILKVPFKFVAGGAREAGANAVFGASGEFAKAAGSNLLGIKRENEIGDAAQVGATNAALHYVFGAAGEVVKGTVKATKATKRAILNGAAKQPIDVMKNVALNLVEKHAMQPEIAEAALKEIERHKAFISQFPNVKDDHSLMQLEDLVHEYNEIKGKLAKPEEGGIHESLHKPLKERQKEVEWEIAMLSQKPEDQIKTLKFKKAELERELADHKQSVADGKGGKMEDAPAASRQLKAVDKKLSEVQERLDSPVYQAQKIVDGELMKGEAEWTDNSIYVEMANRDPEGMLQFIAEQAHDPNSRPLTERMFGEKLTKAAMEAYPKVEKPRHTVSQAGIAAIRPKQRDLSIPEVAETSTLQVGADGKIPFDQFRQHLLDDALAVEDSSFNFRVDIPEMQMSERIGAMKDIETGKESVRRTKLEAAIKQMHESGTVPVTRGRGAHVERYDIPVEEWFGLNRQEQQAVAAETPKMTDEDLGVIESEGITLDNLHKFKHLFDGFPYSEEQYKNIERHLSTKGKSDAEIQPAIEGSASEPIAAAEPVAAGDREQSIRIQRNNDLAEGNITDNNGNPVYEATTGITQNGLHTLTDKTWGHGSTRTRNPLETLKKILGGDRFTGDFGKISRPEDEGTGYEAHEDGAFVIASDEAKPFNADGSIDKSKVEVILNSGLSAFADQLAKEFPGVVIKDFNGKIHSGEPVGEPTAAPAEPTTAGVEPPPQPPVAETAPAATPETIGITHAQTEKIRSELGLPEYQKTPESLSQWDAEASQRLAKNPNEPVEVVDRMANPEYRPTPSDELLVIEYYANLKAKYNAAPSDALLAEIKRVSDITDISGTRWGREGRARQLQVFVEETLADYSLRNMKDTNTDVLTEAQKAANAKEHSEISATQKAIDEKMAKLEVENARLAAENEFLKQKKTATKGRKKTSEDYAREREALRDELKKAKVAHDQWLKDNNIQQAGISGFALTNDMVKVIGKIVKSYVDEGVDKLEDLVAKVFEEVKQYAGEGIVTEKDIHNIIAGEYMAADAKAKPTKSDLAEKLFDLRMEAKMINEMERLQSSQKKNKSESKKQSDNKRLAELREKLRGLKKEVAGTEEEKLAAYKEKKRAQIKEVEEKLKNKDYAKDQKKSLALDDEALDLKYKLIKLKGDREARLLSEKYTAEPLLSADAEMGFGKVPRVVSELLNVPRSLMATGDLSAPLRQGLPAMVSHPIIAKGALKFMHEAAVSDKKFQLWWDAQKNTKEFKYMKEFKLDLTDVHDPKMTAREEAFMGHLVDKVPFFGKELKLGKNGVKIPFTSKKISGVGGFTTASNRAYVAFLNKMRMDIFKQGMEAFVAAGKTPRNSPELYEALATHINNLTGRGKVINPIQAASPILNGLFFSPKLIASRLNLMFNWANPIWYKKTPAAVKAMYLKDMGKFLVFGTTLAGLLKAWANSEDNDDIDFETDPRSSDFLKLKVGNTRVDAYGGFQQYVRAAAQMMTGERKQLESGKILKLDGKGYKGETRMSPLWKMFRGKLAPVPGAAWDLLEGKDMIGNEILYQLNNPFGEHPGGRTKTLDQKAASLLLPMSGEQYGKIFTEHNVKSFIMAGLSAYGAGVQEYEEDEKGSGGQSSKVQEPKAPEAPESPEAPQ